MSGIKKVLTILMACCLMPALAPVAAIAETAGTSGNKWPEIGGWDPKQIGSWVGYQSDACGQYTFKPDGTYDILCYEFMGYAETGTANSIAKIEFTVDGDLLRMTSKGVTDEFRRMLEPYVRITPEPVPMVPSVDALLVGTYGGNRNNDYIEWTFYGDGRFAQVTPYEQALETGYYVAGGGALAILVNGEITQCTYQPSGSFLRLEFPDHEVKAFYKKTGPLVPLSQVPK